MMQRQLRASLRVQLGLVAALASVTTAGCDKNSTSDQTPSETRSDDDSIATRSERREQVQPGADRDMRPKPGEACPMADEGVTVETIDTPEGIALSFTTKTGDVEELRDRVEHMANMYEMHAGHGTMMWHHGSAKRDQRDQGEQQAGMGSTMPAATARSEPTDDGARLVLTPRSPSDLDELRVQVREHQRRMSSGECWSPHAGTGRT